MKRTLSTVLLALMLAGCGTPLTGTVVGREAEAGEFEKDCKRKKQSDGTFKQVCTQKYDDADYTLTVRDAEGDLHDVEVEQAVFDAHPEGATYSDG